MYPPLSSSNGLVMFCLMVEPGAVRLPKGLKPRWIYKVRNEIAVNHVAERVVLTRVAYLVGVQPSRRLVTILDKYYQIDLRVPQHLQKFMTRRDGPLAAVEPRGHTRRPHHRVR